MTGLSRLRTVADLLRHFARRQRLFLLPIIILLLLAGVLLFATTGLGYIAPFVYTLF